MIRIIFFFSFLCLFSCFVFQLKIINNLLFFYHNFMLYVNVSKTTHIILDLIFLIWEDGWSIHHIMWYSLVMMMFEEKMKIEIYFFSIDLYLHLLAFEERESLEYFLMWIYWKITDVGWAFNVGIAS